VVRMTESVRFSARQSCRKHQVRGGGLGSDRTGCYGCLPDAAIFTALKRIGDAWRISPQSRGEVPSRCALFLWSFNIIIIMLKLITPAIAAKVFYVVKCFIPLMACSSLVGRRVFDNIIISHSSCGYSAPLFYTLCRKAERWHVEKSLKPVWSLYRFRADVTRNAGPGRAGDGRCGIRITWHRAT